jgi:uncharacterized membrane protein
MKEQGPSQQGSKGAGFADPPRLRFYAGPLFILLAAAVAIAPQLIRGNSCGHDFDIHLVSWLDCANAWHHGIPYPHWAPSPNYGAGEPRFVFYPPLTWMLGAALGLILPWHLAPIALTFLLLAATGLATRVLARQTLCDGAATLAGCTAIFSGYALFCAYERSAFGELTGGFWVPLALLFILRDCNKDSALWKRALDGSTAPLALVVAGAWLSNAPVGVMVSYSLAAVALAAAVLSKSWVPIARSSIAAGLGMGLASAFLVPAAWEQPWADLEQATLDPGFRVENSWLFARHADPALDFHDMVLHQASMIAVIMVAVAGGGLLVSWRRKSLRAERRWWIPLALIPFAILFLQLSVSLPVWNLLPKLRFLQFPWRWLVAVEAPMAIFFVTAIWPSGRRARVTVLVLCSAIFLASTAYAARVFFQVCNPEDTVASVLFQYRAGAGFEGMDEYEPPGGDHSSIATGLPDACLVSDPSDDLGKPDPDDPDSNPAWSTDQGSCQATFQFIGGNQTNPEHREMRAAVPHAGYLVLRIVSYPAWRIRMNGQVPATLPKRDDGLIVVPVPQGSIDLSIDWTTSPDVLAGRWLSAFSVLLIIALWWVERRRGPARLT